jgi:hypothetical protein
VLLAEKRIPSEFKSGEDLKLRWIEYVWPVARGFSFWLKKKIGVHDINKLNWSWAIGYTQRRQSGNSVRSFSTFYAETKNRTPHFAW